MAWNLPKPTGPHPVGCTDIMTGTGVEGTLFRMYYPTKEFEPSTECCPLWWETPEFIQAFADLINKPKFFLKLLTDIRIPVLMNGPLVMPDGASTLPVVVLSHGLGGSRFFHSFLAYDLASYGFFVAAIEHRDRSCVATFYYEDSEKEGEKYETKWLPWHPMPDTEEKRKKLKNAQVHQRGKELSGLMDCMEALNNGTLTNIFSDFDLSSFKNQLDVARCALLGHSFGGASIIVALQKDDRFKVGVGYDPWGFPLSDDDFRVPMNKPFLFINSDSYQNRGDIVAMRLMDQDVTGTTADRKTTTLVGAVHLTFCDFTFFVRFAWIGKMLQFRGPGDPKDLNEVSRKLTLAYLHKYLDLPDAGDVDALVKENSTLVFSGSSFDITEEEIQKLKDELKAGASTEGGVEQKSGEQQEESTPDAGGEKEQEKSTFADTYTQNT